VAEKKNSIRARKFKISTKNRKKKEEYLKKKEEHIDITIFIFLY